MGLKEVYLSLRDAFPQVDVRILKAVAIEHERDADSAAEFIITEVLPSLESPTDQGLSSRSSAEEVYNPLPIEPSMMNHEETSSDPEGSQVHLDGCDLITNGKESVTALHFVSGSIEWGTSHVTSQDQKASTSAYSSVPLDGVQDTILASKETLPGDKNDMEHLGLATSKTEDEDSVKMGLSSHYFMQVALEPEAHIAVPDISGSVQHFNLSSDLNNEESIPISVKDSPTPSDICTIPGTFNWADKEEEDGATGPIVVNVPQHPTTISTGSSQIVSIDFLQDFINDARSNKKTLASSMECIINLVKEVELCEKAAHEAKSEAAKAGMDILAKVDDLKKMLAHAKETNYMHTGEVYGEKSILATEARELQSRLLSLSGQREKFLSIIEEMRATLEARMVAAEAERKAAVQQRMEKEDKALMELHEQENIMDMVIQESKKLMDEAEQNSKLRDFLMDRGRVVDELQGEIAVVCEDILSLKDKIDRRIPLSSVLQSSQSSSFDSSLSLSMGAKEQAASSGNILIQDVSSSKEPVTAVRDPRPLLDDDWDMFEADVEVKTQ